MIMSHLLWNQLSYRPVHNLLPLSVTIFLVLEPKLAPHWTNSGIRFLFSRKRITKGTGHGDFASSILVELAAIFWNDMRETFCDMDLILWREFKQIAICSYAGNMVPLLVLLIEVDYIL
jgi:hypothetical protein